ncbi:MAG: hypothetical protein EBR79_03385 [Proteobacteria bacterium]|nr:hypothetical protein [Pseudomonadota bacterium]
MFKHIGITLAGFAGQLLLSLASGILAARLLGPEMRGELAALLLLPLTLQLVSLAGLPQAQTVLAAQKPVKAAAITGTTCVLVLLPCLVAILAGLAAVPFLLEDPALQQHAAWVLICLIPLLSFYGIPTSTALGLKHYGIFNLYRIGGSVLYLVAVLFAFFKPDALVISWGYVALLTVVGLPLSYVLCRRYVHGPLRWDAKLIRPLYHFARPTFLSQLPQLLGQRFDQFVVLAVLNTTALGYYSIALAVGQMFATLQQTVGTVLLPYLAGSARDGRNPALLFGSALRVSLALSAAGVTVLGLMLPWLLPLLFGQAFAPAISAAIILLAAYALSGLHTAFIDGFRGIGLPNLPLWSEWLAFACKAVVLGAGVLWLGEPTLLQIALLKLHEMFTKQPN